MPGSGKSHWGQQLSSLLEYQFIDLDLEIEKTERRSISEIIKVDGESHFREAESRILQQIIGSLNRATILSCGGGTPCYNDNLNLLKKNTFSIYLKISESILEANLKDEYHSRPLFRTTDKLLTQIISMKTKREAFYEQADAILEAPLSVEKFKSVIPR